MASLNPENKKVLLTTLGVVIGLLLLAVLIRPAVIGYIAYQKGNVLNLSIEEFRKNITSLEIELAKANTNLSACTEFSQKIFDELDEQLESYVNCAAELNSLAANNSIVISNFERELSDLRAELEKQEKEAKASAEKKGEELANLKNDYEILARNAANNICCKAKVDNPNIKYYSVENNRIVCLETGTKAINC